MVLLAGFTSRATNFSHMAPRLLPNVSSVSILDLPGHGDSDLPADGLTGESLHTGALAALSALTEQPAVIFGNSVGGCLALRHTLTHPQSVLGLGLASPFGAAMKTDEIDRLRELYQVTSHADALDMVDRVFHAPPRWFRPVLAFFARRQIARPELMNLLGSLTAEQTLDLDELTSLETPTQILWGQSDGVLPREHLAWFRRALPHAALIEPADYGHSPFMQQPADVADRVLDFIRGL